MNETIETLRNRRSIRKFKPEQIEEGKLQAVVEAGMYAPSGANQQSAVIVVVQNKETLQKIDRMNAAVFGRDMHPYYGAPTVIIVLADRAKVTPVEDASLVMGNMLNAAAALGLGACWIHREREMFESPEGKALLKEWGVIGDFIGVGACALGYPDMQQPQAAPRKDRYVVYVR
jgi:nitroreductase